MVTEWKSIICLAVTLSSLVSMLCIDIGQPPYGQYVVAAPPYTYRTKCFIAIPKALRLPFKTTMCRMNAQNREGDRLHRVEGEQTQDKKEPPKDPTIGDPSLDPWKTDMADIPGAWRIFYPLALDDAAGLNPNTDIRPSVLFCDISGAVTGPEHPDSGQGSFILDAKESIDIDDGETFVHNRKLAMILLSGKTYSNIRLALLGRIFYSKRYVLNELKGIVQMRAAMFIGQAFVESYRNSELTEALQRIRRRITVLDDQANEVDPLTWEYQPLNIKGSPFRWMHGTDKWKLLGPFTAHRVLGPNVNVPHEPMIFDKYNDKEIYNIVDPLRLNKTKYTAFEKIEEETKRVIYSTLQTDAKSEFSIKDDIYLNQFYEEMVQLAKTGPDFYKGTME